MRKEASRCLEDSPAFPFESLPDNVSPNNTREWSSYCYGPNPEWGGRIREAHVPTHPFEDPTASAAAIRALWNGEIDSAAAATAAAVAGVINCGVLEVERRVLGLVAEVEKEDTVSSIYTRRKKVKGPKLIFVSGHIVLHEPTCRSAKIRRMKEEGWWLTFVTSCRNILWKMLRRDYLELPDSTSEVR